jgi:hypothetical protein
VEWSDAAKSTVLSVFHNNEQVHSQHLDLLIMDSFGNKHYIGAERDHGLTNNYLRGFLYTLRLTQTYLTDFGFEVARTCDEGCEVCPWTGPTCLGTCNWKHYWDTNSHKCVRCP